MVAATTKNPNMENGEMRMGMEELLKGQARLETQVAEMSDKIDALEKAVWGNGRPGIYERLTSIEDHLQRIDKWGELFMKITVPILMALLLLGATAWVQSVT